MPTRTCANCEKTFRITPSRAKSGRGKYCNRNCRLEAEGKNRYSKRLDGTIQVILTRGQVALVDPEDWEWLKEYKWSTGGSRKTFYAHTSTTKNGKIYYIQMHRMILNAPDHLEVDHINWIGTDNRRANIRLCTHSQNAANSIMRKKENPTGFRGVYAKGNRWRACITANNQFIHLGVFNTPQEAAQAYNQAALKNFGEFATLNQLEEICQ